ncbi:nitrous oxide reductase accessory protein NosL [Haloarchaeobius amylolyticus]|uniref:Nitrous oxide reductase accessory protein NosL n=1 Tax=Haloarchaeobius amylolyticus TaxID=1198296 RepID=A0ABD6BGU8_9EURY
MDVPTVGPDDDRRITRRTVLGGVGAASIAALAGCSGGGGNGDGSESVPDPITIDEGKECDQCGMIIGNYLGPAGQSHYEDPTAVLEEDRPAQFCSSLCTYTFTFEHESESEPQVSYLTDYSTVDYEVDESSDPATISRHLEAEAFGDVTELTMVADSDVEGAMGQSIIGFSDADEADEFQSEYGGDVYEHDDVSQELVSSLRAM